MSSHKEEPNASILFGDSGGDDPFSQMLQQNTPDPLNKVDEKKPADVKNTVADASSLFGGANNAEPFFNQQTPVANASNGPAFFEQTSNSFFDGLGQTNTVEPSQQAASLTQAFDPNTYDYSQQQVTEQQYDPNQWIQFDANVHYYYDEQGQVHYYDPNTNQEYDMSQYTYDGQNYDYQYDPQYAEYYAQQGYDPATYANTEQVYDQSQYEATTYDQPNYNAGVAEVPAQIQSEQVIDTQQQYGQNFTEEYQGFEATDVQYMDNGFTEVNQGFVEEAKSVLPPPPKKEAPKEEEAVVSQDQQVPSNEDLETFDINTQETKQDDLNDLDDLVFGGSKNEEIDKQASDELDLLISGSNLESTHKEPVYNPNQYDSPQSDTPEQSNDKSMEIQGKEETQNQQLDEQSLHEPQNQKEQEVDHSSYEPQQNEEPAGGNFSYEPQHQKEQTVDYSSYEPQQESEQPANYNSYEPQQQNDQTVNYSAYEPQQHNEQAVNYSPYEPQQQHEKAVDHTSYEPQQQEQGYSYEPQQQKDQAFAYEPQQQKEQAFAYEPQQQKGQAHSYEPQQQREEQAVDYSSYEPTQQQANYSSYEPQHQNEQTATYSSYEPQQQQAINYSSYEPQQTNNYSPYEPQQQTTNSYEPHQQTANSYEPHQQSEQAVNFTSYEPEQHKEQPYTPYEPQQEQLTNFEPQQEQTTNYAPYEPQQPVDVYQPHQEAVNFSSYEPKPSEEYSGYVPQQTYQPQNAGSTERSMPSQQEQVVPSTRGVISPPPSINQANPPPKNQAIPPPPKSQAVPPPPKNQAIPPSSMRSATLSPPPTRSSTMSPPLMRNIISPPPPRNFSSPQRKTMVSPPPPQQRSNSITEPDRKQTGSPFTYHPYTIERSATVPPPMTERIASPRPALTACPDPLCEGENKAKAKFCCECGRPLAGISRSTTPSANLSPGVFTMVEPKRVDERKERTMESLKKFVASSITVHNNEKLAMEYIESRIEEGKQTLLWNIVKLMIQYKEESLGSGGELDKSLGQLLQDPKEGEDTTLLDKLEEYLRQGDRDGACEFAMQHDLWSHALILSQSRNPTLYKKVVSQFIQRELFDPNVEWKTQAENKKMLRMLYSVFCGAGADAVKEVSRNSMDDSQITKESLDDWKNFVSLILLNRSSNDVLTIQALGDELKTMDRIEDAYTCYMLSPDKSLESKMIHLNDINLDILYLLEFYDFGLGLKLQQFKLLLAWFLKDFGFDIESQKYIDLLKKDISTLEDLQNLKNLGEICTTDSEKINSLLTKTNFDTMIGSIEENIQGNSSLKDDTDKITPEAHDTLQGENYNYGYGYGGGYTTDNNEKPFGIQSPFGNNAVSSPFGHGGYTNIQSTWGAETTESYQSEIPAVTSYQPEIPAVTSYQPEIPVATNYQPEVPTTSSYQPDNYAPALDEDEDLGFGNSKPKPKEEPKEETQEQKPNEISEEKKEVKSGGGWGIFSLFGRKEKDPNAEEKKPVKANLGEQSSFYYDEKEKRWVNKLNDAKPAVEATPPPPKAPSVPASKPSSMPPMRIQSTPNVPTTGGGPPNAAPPTFNTPPVSRRAGAGARKPMRSRYVDVLNTTN